MTDIAMRLETRGGSYTEVSGETSSVFDVTVVVGVGDDEGEFSQEDGRLTLPTTHGTSLNLQATSSGDLTPPTEDLLRTLRSVDKGMYADNPLLADGDIARTVSEVVSNRDSRRVAYTFLGVDAVRYAVAELQNLEPDYRASHVLRAAEFVLDHTQAASM